MSAEIPSYINPHEQPEGITPPALRLKEIVDFLLRNNNFEGESPLVIHIVENAITGFLREGRVSWTNIHGWSRTDPPVRIRISDDEELDDVTRTMSRLEQKGILNFETGKEGFDYLTLNPQNQTL
jgi:hypothetical protein